MSTGEPDVAAIRIDERDGSSILRIRVSPGARRPGIGGVHGDALKVAVSSQPEGGKANRALVDLLAHELGVKRSSVAVVGGQTSRQKKVMVVGIAPARLREMIARIAAGN